MIVKPLLFAVALPFSCFDLTKRASLVHTACARVYGLPCFLFYRCTPGMTARKLAGETAGQADVRASFLPRAEGFPSSTSSSMPCDSNLNPRARAKAVEGADSSEQSLAETRRDAHAGLKEAANVLCPVPAAPTTPACPPAGDAAALSGVDRAPVALKQGHQAGGGSGSVPTAQGAPAPAARGVGNLQGCAQPAVAQGGAEGANLAEADPQLVASEVGAGPVGFSEDAVKEREAGAGVRGRRAGEAPTDEVEASPLNPVGLVLPSIGRDLIFEASLMERLGRLVCEGALIEVVDVHKEVSAMGCCMYVTPKGFRGS